MKYLQASLDFDFQHCVTGKVNFSLNLVSMNWAIRHVVENIFNKLKMV